MFQQSHTLHQKLNKLITSKGNKEQSIQTNYVYSIFVNMLIITVLRITKLFNLT